MFKRNPDAVALVLISAFLLAPTARPGSIHIPKQAVKVRLQHSVASLKQCLHLRSTRRPTQRPI